MKKIPCLLLAGCAALGSTSAMAQEEPYFGGVYGGVAIGYGINADEEDGTVTFDRGNDGSFGETVTTLAGADAFSPGFCGGEPTSTGPGTGCVADRDGVDYAVRLGYDAMVGQNLLVGLVGEFGNTSLVDTATAFSTTPANYAFRRETQYVGALRARAGLTSGKALVYATGGAVYAKMDNSFSSTNTANTFTQNGADKWEWGWQAGAGAELALTRNASIGVEYLYNRINNDGYSVTVGQGTAGATNPFVLAGGVTMKPEEDAFQWHSIRATMNFRF